jgi:hypothetical protein
MWGPAVRYTFAGASEEPTVSIFKVEDLQNNQEARYSAGVWESKRGRSVKLIRYLSLVAPLL